MESWTLLPTHYAVRKEMGRPKASNPVRSCGPASTSKRSKPDSETTPGGPIQSSSSPRPKYCASTTRPSSIRCAGCSKDKQVRLGEFDRLVEQRRRERENIALRAKRRTAAQAARAAARAATDAPRVVGGGVQVGRYLANAQGLFLLKFGGRGAPLITLPLANFTARITAEIKRDDSVDAMREFEIHARLGGQTRRLMVAAAQFASMKWVTEQLGARAVIAAGMGIKDQVREAIQLLSAQQIVERTVHTHTGWRKLDGGWYCMAGCAGG